LIFTFFNYWGFMRINKVMFQLATVVATAVLFSGSGFAEEKFAVIAGEWQRTDGNYLITVSDVQANGQATVQYFNPRPIHIAKAAVSPHKGFVQLSIEFQDRGYEGSTYLLYYYAEEDSLVGYYYQAKMDRTYKVGFIRK
jgi:uncharacterized protein (DUF2147 family)